MGMEMFCEALQVEGQIRATSGLKPSQQSHIRYTNTIFLLQDGLKPAKSTSSPLENHTNFTVPEGQRETPNTRPPWLHISHTVNVWPQFRWEQKADTSVGSVMRPQAIAISGSTTRSRHSLTEVIQSLKTKGLGASRANRFRGACWSFHKCSAPQLPLKGFDPN